MYFKEKWLEFEGISIRSWRSNGGTMRTLPAGLISASFHTDNISFRTHMPCCLSSFFLPLALGWMCYWKILKNTPDSNFKVKIKCVLCKAFHVSHRNNNPISGVKSLWLRPFFFFIKIAENLFCKVKIFEIVLKVLVFIIEKPPGEVITFLPCSTIIVLTYG